MHHSCCHVDSKKTTLKSSALATAHCLTGCTIGEFAGLAIGVSLGLTTTYTITLAIFLAFISGFALTIFPLMSREQIPFRSAFRAIWLGEIISISAMELVMNVVDYQIGGVQVMSMADPIFWIGLALALPAGYLAAWPINYWLLGKELKKCH